MFDVAQFTDRQLNIFRAFGKLDYFGLSASEFGDPEIQKLFNDGFVEHYSGVGGHYWHLARKGREAAVDMGFRRSADQLVIDAATGKIERVP